MSMMDDLNTAGERESSPPSWTNIRLIYSREMRDQLRDRRTLFTIIVLPILLYPLVGTLLLQIAQFSREFPAVICVVGSEHLEDLPPLQSETHFADGLSDSKSRLELVRYRWDEFANPDDIHKNAETWVRDSIYDVVLLLPPQITRSAAMPNTAETAATVSATADPVTAKLATGLTAKTTQPAESASGSPIEVIYNVAADQSLVARDRVMGILDRWREVWVARSFQEQAINPELLHPFQVASRDIAPASVREAAFWSKMLPFVMLVWAMTGAFYPAIDLVAGEKERGTLETLLCSPALRSEIVWGKLAAVTTFSMLTAILNVSSMLVTSALVFRQMALSSANAFASPPLVPLLWLVVALVPLSALFSAVALAVAAMARSSKEGQYYLMPLMMVSLPLVLLPLMPGTTLSIGTSLIPVTGMFLLVRALVEGQYATVLMYLPIVMSVTIGALCLATRWARRQFEAEAVLFAGGEQWQLSHWARRMWEDRQNLATPMQAYMATALVLIALFFGKLAVTSMPTTFAEIAKLVIVPQLGLILAPTMLFAIICTRSLKTSLRLALPASRWALPMAVLLGISLHPIYVLLAGWISTVYPISDNAIAAMKPFTDQITSAPLLPVLFLMAVLPALCEELTFRGFIFGGLSRDGFALRAILITSVAFGVSHGVLQQSLSATCMGLVLGWLAFRTGSVLPGILLHVTNNALSVSLPRLAQTDHTLANLFVQNTTEGAAYQPMWTVLAGCVALCCMLYFSFQEQKTPLPGDVAEADQQPLLCTLARVS